ncbi:MAG: TIGR01212 family radical SAM protein [Desulfobacteraceae bacterium]|nr:TIGR01212 family radical SAM protein [Desulfobacteraceae bacterium]
MYLSLNKYLRSVFGQRVQKIPLDAGLGCPNRDGIKGRAGCIYCDSKGSGTGAYRRGIGIKAQMEGGMKRAGICYNTRKFIAYFQSFSNTYADHQTLERLYTEALVGPEVVGLSMGTRPDCVDEEILGLISRVAKDRMVWMEYGLQSASDATLLKINRGHSVSNFVEAVSLTRRFGFLICAHVIFGLPGEDRAAMEDTVRFLADLKVDGVKFHQLYVVRDTALHSLYDSGGIRPMEQEEYADMAAWAISRLPKDTVIQRLVGAPPRDRLVAPLWSLDKAETIAQILKRL